MMTAPGSVGSESNAAQRERVVGVPVFAEKYAIIQA
jgi:hypothetical protein